MADMGSSIRGILGMQEPIESVGFRKCPIALLMCDSDGIIYCSNPEADELLQSPYPLQGESVHQFVAQPEHSAWVQTFVNNPIKIGRDYNIPRRLAGQTSGGERVELWLALSHAMFDGNRLAIAAFWPADE